VKHVRMIAPSGCTFRGFSVDGKDLVVNEKGEIDVPEHLVRDFLAEGFKRAASSEVVILQGPQGADGLEGKQGIQGERGPVGHQWDGTEVRFEIEPGEWGSWVDLQGPKGEPGRDGVGGSVGGFGGLGAGPIDLSGLVTSVNSYFPAGW
jgi:hypothetical protein